MTKVTYEIVPHDGGWAYRVNGTYSEPFASQEEAHSAAERAAAEQRTPGDTEGISWEDDRGRWHSEVAQGNDRPDAEVED